MPQFKAVLIGDSTVGKTAIFQRLENNTFEESHIPTVGGGFMTINFDNQGEDDLSLGVWDTAGQERFRNIVPMYFQNADIIIVVFDITNRSSFDNIDSWIELAQQRVGDSTYFILVGNKSDLEDLRAVNIEEMSEKCESRNLFRSLETSALSGNGFDFLRQSLLEACQQNMEKHTQNKKDQPNVVVVQEQNNNIFLRTAQQLKQKCNC